MRVGIAITFMLGTLLTVGLNTLKAQELQCEVSVDKSKINSSSISYVDDLEGIVQNYLNEYDWTDEEYREFERISCSVQIILTSMNNSSQFSANIIISSKRPIYNTLQESPVILINDNNWTFTFKQGTSLTHDEVQFSDIATLLDYYAYLIIGFDHDTFASMGGAPYFNQAQSIVDMASSTSASGWSSGMSTDRNRYNLIYQLNNQSYDELRQGIYRYHRLGLDKFLDQPEQARQNVLQALKMVQESKRKTTNNYLFDLFFNAKYKEITSIFQDADTDIRLEAYNLLSELDSSHMSEYNKLQ